MRLAILFLFFGYYACGQIIVSGTIREQTSGEQIPYASVSMTNGSIGTFANEFGYYSIEIPSGKPVELNFSSVGYLPYAGRIAPLKDSVINVTLETYSLQLHEVVVTDISENEPFSKTNGHSNLSLKTVGQLPSLLGEKDVLKTIQLLPGVQRATEGSAALYVRGGTPDQNLIILDGAPVYNTNHLFGFVSVFNGDAIKHVDFWKAGYPARYGGRVSSVIDLQMKDGNKEKITGTAGIGILSSRLTIEGPLLKKKSSFLIAARRSYLDILLFPFMARDNKQTYRFYDFNAKINQDFGARDKIIVSAYLGSDKLISKEKENISSLNSTTSSAMKTDSRLGWGNATLSARWNHIISTKLFLNTTFIYSGFRFLLTDEVQRTGMQQQNDFTSYRSSIQDVTLKTDLDYFRNNTHTLRTGAMITNHTFRPKAYKELNRINDTSDADNLRYVNQEFGVYAEDNWRPTEKLSIEYGVRLSGLNTTSKMYHNLEPRMSMTKRFSGEVSINGSYTRSNQFIHLLSNTGIGLSTDLWVPVTEKAPPQQSDQFSAGISKRFSKPGLQVSVETFRKYTRNILAYTEGATFQQLSEGISDLDWEDNITTGKGVSYGTELMIEKKSGKLTGWIGYTLSWVVHQFDSINNAQKFFPKYDSRHNLSVLAAYQLTPRISLSLSWVYNTGNAFTIPQGFYPTNITSFSPVNFRGINEPYIINTELVSYYGSRNGFRGEAYHRLDIEAKFFRKKKRFERYWAVGLFNAYNRKNPLYYYMEKTYYPEQNKTIVELKKRSFLPIIPSISYNIQF